MKSDRQKGLFSHKGISEIIGLNVSTLLILNCRHHKLRSRRPGNRWGSFYSLQEGNCVAIEPRVDY